MELLDELKIFVSKLNDMHPIANAHMVNFITNNTFKTVLPKPIQDDIMSLSINDLNNIMFNSIPEIGPYTKSVPNIVQFVLSLKKLTLRYNEICLSLEDLCNTLKFNIPKGNNYPNDGNHVMPLKKSHEVYIMSYITDLISQVESCSHIVDIGGGKGYLSSILSLKYKLKVLSIDSSQTVSKSAETLMSKVEKHTTVQNLKDTISDSNSINQTSTTHKNTKSLCKYATQCITEDTDIMGLLDKNFSEDEVNGITLVGLHTCGNLAATSLCQFARNPEKMKCLLNVGCCYNLIVEEFDRCSNPSGTDHKAVGIGFPLSNYLKTNKFSIGRNARMLAAQPMDRLSVNRQLQTKSLFYRALLEYYLHNKLCIKNEGLPNFKIGKLGKKCSTFLEYVHKSVKHLGLDIQVDEDEVNELYNNNAESQKQLHAFYLLRIIIAPVVEAVIMLDRLLYLHEQGIYKAYLTQLFNPVISPRCTAIIAFHSVQSSQQLN